MMLCAMLCLLLIAHQMVHLLDLSKAASELYDKVYQITRVRTLKLIDNFRVDGLRRILLGVEGNEDAPEEQV